jgi:5'-3' exonuclease
MVCDRYIHNTSIRMGIRGLTGLLRWNNSIEQKPDWSSLKGKVVGIDILGFLYKAKAQHQSIFQYLAKLVVACRKCGIEAVPIFDGKPPSEKRNALKQRSELRVTSDAKKRILERDLETVPLNNAQRLTIESVLKTLTLNSSFLTSDERDQAKQFFYACGVLCLNATGEADNAIAYFARRGDFAAVISNDLDFLARGVETLLVPQSNAYPGDNHGWQMYSLPRILNDLKFTYQQFLEMCVLMGCDYTVGHHSIPYRSAYWAVKYAGSLRYALLKQGVHDFAPYERAIDILRGNESPECMMGEKQWNKWAAGPPQPEPDTLATLRPLFGADFTDADYALLGCGSTHKSFRDNPDWVSRCAHDHPKCADSQYKQYQEQDCR